ncbi:hypothetical protein GCM10007966_14960 [Legionella impletisoli]|uniref:Uncharacterized protein n=1 Tax=Legionella impletisoli TaxID=343510 RepID=A0A917JU62_9GAMM|nr:hypothetical protein GCM10007966_14960 [Legionella impletisoli]
MLGASKPKDTAYEVLYNGINKNLCALMILPCNGPVRMYAILGADCEHAKYIVALLRCVLIFAIIATYFDYYN